MKYNEVKKSLNKQFGNSLKMLGFVKWRYGFAKLENDIFKYFVFSIFDYADFYQSSFSLSTGLISIAKIQSSIYGEKYNSKTSRPSHFVLSQEGLCDDKIFDSPDFTLVKDENIGFMVETVVKFMKDRGFKMLQEKSTLRGLENYVNHDCDIMYRNNVVGLILAKLLNKDYYHKLVYEYGEEVNNWVSEEKKEVYYKIEKFLITHSREELLEIGGITEGDLA